jgi:hypothetical protein
VRHHYVVTLVLAFASGLCAGNDATFWLGLALALACGVSYALSRRTPPGDMHRERWLPGHGWVMEEDIRQAADDPRDQRLRWLYHNDPYVRRMVDHGIAQESEHDGPL